MNKQLQISQQQFTFSSRKFGNIFLLEILRAQINLVHEAYQVETETEAPRPETETFANQSEVRSRRW
jgi:hypothetical protein